MPLRRITWTVALVAGLLAGRPCAAFESGEHLRLSNLAFHFALALHCDHRPMGDTECDKWRETFAEGWDLDRGGSVRSLSYGDVVRCVDFFLTPEKMIAGRENGLFSTDRAPTAPSSTSILPHGAADFRDVAFDRHCRDSVFNLSATQAAHSNHAHFQAETIASQALYHRLALGLSREGRHFSALFVNAISDHYLQDFFAPGHIGTFRSHMSDIYSNALHDSMNASGASLHFQLSDLRALIDSLPDPALGRSGLKRVRLDERARLQLSCLPAQSGFDAFMRRHEADICIDRSAQPQDLAWLADVDDLDALFALLPAGPGHTDAAVRMTGDNRLWKPAQREQRLLMLALQMRSVLDVLRAPREGAGNWFADGHWQSSRAAPGRDAVIRASIDGRFEFRLRFPASGSATDEGASRLAKAVAPAASAPVPAGAAAAGGLHTSPPETGRAEGAADDVVKIARLRARTIQLLPTSWNESVLSAGLNYEMPRFGRNKSRVSVSLETPVLAFLNLGSTKINFGMAAGVFRFREDSDWKSGVSLRPGFVFSQSETFLTFPLRWFHYRLDSGATSWEHGAGVRLDQGFSSFMTVYLEVTRGPFQQHGQHIARGKVFAAGVVFAAPLCRIPKVGGWLC